MICDCSEHQSGRAIIFKTEGEQVTTYNNFNSAGFNIYYLISDDPIMRIQMPLLCLFGVRIYLYSNMHYPVTIHIY
jgi:hypothetical protein